MSPLCIELYCGTFGWSHGWLALGGRAVGFDIAHEDYHGPIPPNANLVLQDVRTLHGRQFRDAQLILASPPCQEFSYRAMPWKRARELPPPELGMELFAACFRIQREASEAAGRHIPMVVENVKGAQKYVGRPRWHYGSYYLWGDVPALMPFTSRGVKVTTMGAGWYPPGHPKHVRGLGFNTHAERQIKNAGGSWFAVSHNKTPHSRGDGVKVPIEPVGTGKERGSWFHNTTDNPLRATSAGSKARKAASALIARIPEPLSLHIAHTYFPDALGRSA